MKIIVFCVLEVTAVNDEPNEKQWEIMYDEECHELVTI